MNGKPDHRQRWIGYEAKLSATLDALWPPVDAELARTKVLALTSAAERAERAQERKRKPYFSYDPD
jgi:hypothetical protein